MAVLTEEQNLLRDTAREWTRERSPVTALRRVRDDALPLGYDPVIWAEMSAMGWAGVIVPEVYNGSGFGYLGLGLIHPHDLDGNPRDLGGELRALLGEPRAGVDQQRLERVGVGREFIVQHREDHCIQSGRA